LTPSSRIVEAVDLPRRCRSFNSFLVFSMVSRVLCTASRPSRNYVVSTLTPANRPLLVSTSMTIHAALGVARLFAANPFVVLALRLHSWLKLANTFA
jgi:hypothetical protein